MPGILEEKDVSLANIGQGAAIEQFDYELQRVLKNIMDPNTQAKAKRSITLKLTVQPSEDRDYANTSISVKSDLAPLKEFEIPIHIGLGPDGKPIARQSNFKQRTFADIPKNNGNVTTLERKQQS